MCDLGKRIKELRINANLSQQELGIIAGLHSTNIGRIENGKVFPTSDVLFRIASYFHVSCDYLITGHDATTESTIGIDMILLKKFHKLSENNQQDIMEFIDFKLMQQEQKKETEKSYLSESENKYVC